jgi:drug/metabolite transporter (DMT)-like permease
MKKKYGTNLLLLHIIVLVWGLTGILGREISLEPFLLVWWRVLIATASILLIARVLKARLRVKPTELWKFAFVGLITAAHWVCFFAAIKYSKISIALVLLSTSAFFVSILHPLIRRQVPKPYEMALGLIVMVGVLMIFKFEATYTLGIFLSLAAAFLAALFSTLNARLVATHGPATMAFWEMLFASVGLSLFLLVSGYGNSLLNLPNMRDLQLLFVLGVLCTGVAFIVSIQVMKVLSPFTCALAINMEPVYTILLALVLYGSDEWMSPEFYMGGAVILSTLFIDTLVKSRGIKRDADYVSESE